MIKSTIVLDLPSEETQRKRTLSEWFGSLAGKDYDLGSGEEVLTIGAMSLVTGIVNAFQRAGVDNAISLIVDRKVVYIDHQDNKQDADLLIEAAARTAVLSNPFEEMHVVLDHHEQGLHTLADVRIRGRVLTGEEEMHVVLSSRVEELRVQRGESAHAYGGRVAAFAQRPNALEEHRGRLQALSERLTRALLQALPGAAARPGPARVELIRPEGRQIGRFRDLGFGNEVRPPSYRPVPTHHRHGAYADPFFYYYYDPYYDLASWVLVSSMLTHQCLADPSIAVVNPQGGLLYTADDHARQRRSQWDGADAVTLDSHGTGLEVADSIPQVSSTADNIVEIAGPDVRDSGGGGIHAGDGGGALGDAGDSADAASEGGSFGGFFSDLFGGGSDGSSDGSSCGSSCGGSSCGSSCGGGCGS